MLQSYQTMPLAELGENMPPDSPLVPLINKVRIATDHILHASLQGERDGFYGCGTEAQWLTLSDVPERDRAIYLDEPLSPGGLFGLSLDAIQTKFELRK